jgi:hypothetical protein
LDHSGIGCPAGGNLPGMFEALRNYSAATG